MTSGVEGDTSLLGQQWVGGDAYRSWVGADGKYEVLPHGSLRPRWNNYQFSRVVRSCNSNLWTCTRLSNGQTFSVLRNAGGTLATPPMPGSIALTAQSRLADKVRGHSFNLAVNAAQGRQLVDMVVGNLGKLGRAALDLKHGNFAAAARRLGVRPRASRLKPSDVSGRWLELQYGWLPSLSDTFEAAKAYEHITKEPRTSTVRAGATVKLTRNGSSAPTTTLALQHGYQSVNYVFEMYEDLTTPRSLGLTDPLSVAWEVLPWSFVVDWFVPIGSYLDTLNVIPFLKGRTLTTEVWQWTGNQTTCIVPMPGFFGGVACSKVEYLGTDNLLVITVKRTVSGYPPAVRFPSFDSHGLRGKRIWNAIALAHQRFR